MISNFFLINRTTILNYEIVNKFLWSYKFSEKINIKKRFKIFLKKCKME